MADNLPGVSGPSVPPVEKQVEGGERIEGVGIEDSKGGEDRNIPDNMCLDTFSPIPIQIITNRLVSDLNKQGKKTFIRKPRPIEGFSEGNLVAPSINKGEDPEKIKKRREFESLSMAVMKNSEFQLWKRISQNVIYRAFVVSTLKEKLTDSKDEATLCSVGSSSKSSEYRPINISVNFYSDPECKIKVSTTAFFPHLKVDAAIVSFKLKKSGGLSVFFLHQKLLLNVNNNTNFLSKFLFCFCIKT
ncbi:ribosomal RNA small subunit methyltransferase A [Striga asiatica]|uniref:Ribosomal RNA small subunit methyltransferase A n=1 Tax=Striga asiatica TaxID=4170 RepID=A0A5A7QG76_STRAF|nr:ribosomal RNA small subunit methyltransferase A [Striga asiatica]